MFSFVNVNMAMMASATVETTSSRLHHKAFITRGACVSAYNANRNITCALHSVMSAAMMANGFNRSCRLCPNQTGFKALAAINVLNLFQ